MLVGYVDEIPVDPVLMRTKTVGKHLVKVVQLPEEVEARMRDCHYQSRYSKKLSQQRYQYRATIVPGARSR
jgi:hypothetical protein